MKGKKIISLLLALVLVFSFGFTSEVMAANYMDENIVIKNDYQFNRAYDEVYNIVYFMENYLDDYELSYTVLNVCDSTTDFFRTYVEVAYDLGVLTYSDLRETYNLCAMGYNNIIKEDLYRSPLVKDIDKFYDDINDMTYYEDEHLSYESKKKANNIMDNIDYSSSYRTDYSPYSLEELWGARDSLIIIRNDMVKDIKVSLTNTYGGEVKLYKSKGANIRDEYDNQVGVLTKYKLIEGIENDGRVIFLYNGRLSTVSRKHVEEVLHSYISKGANVRDSKGQKIGYLAPGQGFKGFKDGKRIRINYKSQIGYLPKSMASLEEKIYSSKGVNVRDLYGNRMGYLGSDYRVKGQDKGGYIKIPYRGVDGYVSHVYFNEFKSLYRSKGVNVRSLSGKKLGYMARGTIIEGERKGNYVHINYKGNQAKVHKNFIEDSYAKYESYGVNVRNSKGEKIGYLKRGERLSGVDEGLFLRTSYKGQRVRIPLNYMKAVRLSYSSKGVNLRNSKGQKVGYLKRGQVVRGIDRGAYIEITYNNQTCFVAKQYLIRK